MSDIPESGSEPTEEELAAQFAEQLAKTPVRDIMLQSLATLIDAAGIRIGYGPVGERGRDLAQAKQAIEGASALLEATEKELGEEYASPFREPVRVLKMAYVQAMDADKKPSSEPDDAPPGPVGGEPTADEPDRASRLWVPPGARKDT